MNRPTSDRLDISEEAHGMAGGSRPEIKTFGSFQAFDTWAREREEPAPVNHAERRAAFRFLGFCCLWALIFGALCVVAAL